MKTSLVLAASFGLTLANLRPRPPGKVAVQDWAPWNLRAVSHRSPPTALWPTAWRNFKYNYRDWAGDETYYVYVMDTGIRTTHQELEGRAENLFTLFKTADGEDDFEDRSGHGTHVAGIVASKAYGVAKKARVVSVKVLDESNTGLTSQMIKGFHAAVNDIIKKGRFNNAVVNLSLAGPCSAAWNAAVDRALNHRDGSKPGAVLTVASAGNEKMNAESCSPASASRAITVGSIRSDWRMAPSSNFGAKVNILAPGANIVSLSHESDSETATMSGTSMAAPHVAALALNAMSVFGRASHQVPLFLQETCTKDKVKGDLRGSPNALVNNNTKKQ
ncbi:subtilisin-like protease PR1F [Metarhizium album ARSEF 1941]|uniref:Subtilisin-like protease PR1F n=1 Tax=Metarhizium album (strain ARSEF 1941) TaxID=1081103 RepID=A0A0B2WJ60_METAS|nr:subtilisin-like protease PR1F [Metarhizium album ARSEF 1941]KHN96081.1 subtilisin-like protease PR1F [Metarhizium album ARSEF 1941]